MNWMSRMFRGEYRPLVETGLSPRTGLTFIYGSLSDLFCLTEATSKARLLPTVLCPAGVVCGLTEGVSPVVIWAFSWHCSKGRHYQGGERYCSRHSHHRPMVEIHLACKGLDCHSGSTL